MTLCPAWFTAEKPIGAQSARPRNAVDRATNRFRGSGKPLERNLRSWMLHELVHVYLIAATNRRVSVREVYDLNACFRLRADEQKYMPNNYVYYAGSMFFSLLVSRTVQQKHSFWNGKLRSIDLKKWADVSIQASFTNARISLRGHFATANFRLRRRRQPTMRSG